MTFGLRMIYFYCFLYLNSTRHLKFQFLIVCQHGSHGFQGALQNKNKSFTFLFSKEWCIMIFFTNKKTNEHNSRVKYAKNLNKFLSSECILPMWEWINGVHFLKYFMIQSSVKINWDNFKWENWFFSPEMLSIQFINCNLRFLAKFLPEMC